MINTYNETDLHLSLKKIYALESEARTEVKIEGTKWIADIMTKAGDVIEIQTSNISALTQKVAFLLENGKKVTVVHPIVENKFIEMYLPDGTLKSRKKSPQHKSIYSILRGLTKIYPYLTHENFTLEILYVEISEERRITAAPVQLTNCSRRHLKNWVPMEKKLEKILRKEFYRTKDDYKNLIPKKIQIQESPFRQLDLINAIYDFTGRKTDAKYAPLLIWLFTRMGILDTVQEKPRRLYKVLPATNSLPQKS